MSTALSRESILNFSDEVKEKVDIPQWNGYVYVKSLTGQERDDFEASCLTGRGKSRDVNLKNMRAKLLVLTVIDESGKHLFTHSDIEALGKKNASALDKIFSVSQRLAGIGEQDIENLTKNSEPDQS